MELTQDQYERIAPLLPVQRGNVSIPNLQVLNALLYVAEHGCKWRGLPPRFGRWHTIYTRMNRWAKNGVLDRVFEHLQREQIVRVKLEAVSMDSTIVVHPDGLKKRATVHRKVAWRLDHQDSGRCSNGHDLLPFPVLHRLGPQQKNLSIVMDRAYEGNETRQLALELGFAPVVPPLSSRVAPWEYDKELYKRRNEVERLFRRLKGFRRIFSRFDKLDVLFLGFILLALIFDALRSVNTP